MKKLFSVLFVLLFFSVSFVAQSPSQQVIVSQKITVAGGPFVNDTFTQGSDVNLSSHTGEIGATWTLHSSYSGVVTNDSTLDRIYLTSASAAMYYASGVPSSANYCTKSDFTRSSQFGNNFAITLGNSTSADTALMLRLNDTGAAVQWEVMDRTAGSNTILNGGTAVTGANVPTVGGAAVTAEICRSGTSVTVFFNGVQDTGLNSTTSLTDVGRCGMRISGTASSTTGIHIDNFVCQ